MLNIKIVCVGKVKEKSMLELIKEYTKRISKYAKIEIIELDDEPLPYSLNDKLILKVKEAESNKIKNYLQKLNNASIFFLSLKGKEYTSIEFAEKISYIATYDSSTIAFVIGGSLGMTDELMKISSENICFSKLTFPHQLIRVFLLEQIFRSFKILNKESYHH